MPRTGAVSRIYAQLRPLRNVRALLPPSRLAAVPGASKQCAVRRGSRRATRGAWAALTSGGLVAAGFPPAQATGFLENPWLASSRRLFLGARVANARASRAWKRSAPYANSPALLTHERSLGSQDCLDWQTGKWSWTTQPRATCSPRSAPSTRTKMLRDAARSSPSQATRRNAT